MIRIKSPFKRKFHHNSIQNAFNSSPVGKKVATDNRRESMPPIYDMSLMESHIEEELKVENPYDTIKNRSFVDTN